MKTEYDFCENEHVIIYEIMLPKRHKRKLREVLDEFLDPQKLRESPPVKKWIEAIGEPIWQKKILEQFMEAIAGYSMYEVRGRFVINGKTADEKTNVVRIIVRNPNNETKDQPGIYKLSWNVISFFVTRRFAEELEVEDEIWFTECSTCLLSRWVRKGTNNSLPAKVSA